MWRSHFVVLSEEPPSSGLARVRDGYQLWHETLTGLYYLTAHSELLAARPHFGDFLDRVIDYRLDLSVLKRLISGVDSTVNVPQHEVSFELVQQTATLAKQLAMPVLVAEDTDDEYGMAVMVDNGAITYLRFKTTAMDAA